LDSTQYLTRIVSSLPLDPTDYPAWKKENLVIDAVRRNNLGEATAIRESKIQGSGNPFPLYENAFMDLRQSMMGVGNSWDQDYDGIIFQDKEEQSAICMRVSVL